MSGRLWFVLIVVAFTLTFAACGKGNGSPTAPGGSNQLPVTAIPPGQEVYTPQLNAGQTVYAHTRFGDIKFPDGCLKAEPRRISPARGSKLPDDYEVAIDLVVSMCAEAPLSQLGDGATITPMYDMVDDAGNHATDWLSGGAGPVAAGQSRDIRWSSRVYGVTERSNAATEERLKSGHAVGGLSIV